MEKEKLENLMRGIKTRGYYDYEGNPTSRPYSPFAENPHPITNPGSGYPSERHPFWHLVREIYMKRWPGSEVVKYEFANKPKPWTADLHNIGKNVLESKPRDREQDKQNKSRLMFTPKEWMYNEGIERIRHELAEEHICYQPKLGWSDKEEFEKSRKHGGFLLRDGIIPEVGEKLMTGEITNRQELAQAMLDYISGGFVFEFDCTHRFKGSEIMEEQMEYYNEQIQAIPDNIGKGMEEVLKKYTKLVDKISQEVYGINPPIKRILQREGISYPEPRFDEDVLFKWDDIRDFYQAAHPEINVHERFLDLEKKYADEVSSVIDSFMVLVEKYSELP